MTFWREDAEAEAAEDAEFAAASLTCKLEGLLTKANVSFRRVRWVAQ